MLWLRLALALALPVVVVGCSAGFTKYSSSSKWAAAVSRCATGSWRTHDCVGSGKHCLAAKAGSRIMISKRVEVQLGVSAEAENVAFSSNDCRSMFCLGGLLNVHAGGTFKGTATSFENGKAYRGGAVYNYGVFKCSGCSFTKNVAVQVGGAIDNSGFGTSVGDMTLTLPVFSGNKAQSRTAGVDVRCALLLLWLPLLLLLPLLLTHPRSLQVYCHRSQACAVGGYKPSSSKTSKLTLKLPPDGGATSRQSNACNIAHSFGARGYCCKIGNDKKTCAVDCGGSYVWGGCMANGKHLGTFKRSVASNGGRACTAGLAATGSTRTKGCACSGSKTIDASDASKDSAKGTIDEAFGRDYAPKSNCGWTIVAPFGRKVKLTFAAFSTESGADYVEIFNGKTRMAKLSGSEGKGQSYLSTGNRLTVKFTSDDGGERAGFTANWAVGDWVDCIGTWTWGPCTRGKQVAVFQQTVPMKFGGKACGTRSGATFPADCGAQSTSCTPGFKVVNTIQLVDQAGLLKGKAGDKLCLSCSVAAPCTIADRLVLAEGVTVETKNVKLTTTKKQRDACKTGACHGGLVEVHARASFKGASTTFDNGMAVRGGAAWIDAAGSFECDSCLFSNCMASDFAGAIINYGSLQLTQPSFFNNKARNLGSAPDVRCAPRSKLCAVGAFSPTAARSRSHALPPSTDITSGGKTIYSTAGLPVQQGACGLVHGFLKTGFCCAISLSTPCVLATYECKVDALGVAQAASPKCKSGQTEKTSRAKPPVGDPCCSGALKTKAIACVLCPVNCFGQAVASSWSECSAKCGAGTRSYTFRVIAKAANGGAACTTADGARVTQYCKIKDCRCPEGQFRIAGKCDTINRDGTVSRAKSSAHAAGLELARAVVAATVLMVAF